MFIVKNLEELKGGSIKCLILQGESWERLVMSPIDEYEIHESSEWPDIKPCPQSEKDAHALSEAIESSNQEAKSYLTLTDWYVLREMDTGVPIPSEVKTKRAEARAKVV